MGYDIGNNQDYFHANIASWCFLLNTAIDHGWKPLGTIHDEYDDWNGSYTSNDGQIILAEDGQNFANALELALKDESDGVHATRHRDFINTAAKVLRSGSLMIT